MVRSSPFLSLIAAASLVWLMAPFGGAQAAPASAKDLAWGETLFYFFQRDNVPAITRVLVARQRGEFEHHAEEAELVLGGIYLDYNMHRHAGEVFEALLAGNARPEIRDQAWYYLARVRYESGLPGPALDALGRIGDKLPRSLMAERYDLEARSLLLLDRPAEAAAVLADHELPGGWRNYGWYNLGVALVRSNQAERGEDILEKVGSVKTRAGELDVLRDRANLALGFSRLASGDPEGARAALDRVRLDSPYATRALLGAGWADSTRGDYKAALGPWTELAGRDPLDSAVQESLLALPYAYAELDAPGRAVNYYERAVDLYEQELDRLQEGIDGIRSGRLTAAVLHLDADGSPLKAADEPRYLYSLMAEHSFRTAVRGLRDLDAMDQLLGEWADSMVAFDDMLAAHRQRFASRRELINASADQQRIDGMRASYESARNDLERIRQDGDAMGLASRQERQIADRLARVLEQAPPGSPERRQAEFLDGVLRWNVHGEFLPRLRAAEKNLKASERALEEAGGALQRVRNAEEQEPGRFAEFSGRIDASSARLVALRERIAAATRRQAVQLESLAVAELTARQRRVTAYLSQARYALAASYDRAALAEAQP
ncbi:MAG: hypothetical protein PVG91_06850 [Gammaproteobacteria bacterium]|jgi:hypothetical protein